jgi:methylphosphotriester-DNA--protein-cysteine methyltransferase
MLEHRTIDKLQIRSMIRKGMIRFAGNRKLKIYGHLNCASGKKMRAMNRVFFASESDAKSMGYRPCGHCMKKAYNMWKQNRRL